MQRGVTRLKTFNLSQLFTNVGNVAAASLQATWTVVRAHHSVANSATRMYVLVVDAAALAIHVLALSAAIVTHAGALEWPALRVSGRPGDKPLKCASSPFVKVCEDLRLETEI